MSTARHSPVPAGMYGDITEATSANTPEGTGDGRLADTEADRVPTRGVGDTSCEEAVRGRSGDKEEGWYARDSAEWEEGTLKYGTLHIDQCEESHAFSISTHYKHSPAPRLSALHCVYNPSQPQHSSRRIRHFLCIRLLPPSVSSDTVGRSGTRMCPSHSSK